MPRLLTMDTRATSIYCSTSGTSSLLSSLSIVPLRLVPYSFLDLQAQLMVPTNRSERVAQCKAENPYFFAAPVSFLVGGSGAYQFISLFANHSAERPEGRLDQETLKSFFAIAGSGPGNFVYKEGWEKIPINWYRRPIGYEVSVLQNSYTNHQVQAP